MRPLRVGVAVGHGAVRAIAARDGRLLWATNVPLDTDEALAAAIQEVLQQVPRQRWRPPTITVALGAPYARLRRLSGLPPIDTAVVVRDLVRTNLRAYFLALPDSYCVSMPVRGGEGAWWIACAQGSAVEGIETAAAEAGCRLRAIMAAGALVPIRLGLPGINGTGPGGQLHAVQAEEGLLTAITRQTGPAGAAATLPTDLNQFGERAWELLEAFAATIPDDGVPVPSWPLAASDPRRPLPRWRMGLAGSVLAAGLCTFILAPGGQAWWGAQRAEAAVRDLETLSNPALAAESELAQYLHALGEYERFRAAGVGRVIQALSLVSEALPGGSALTSVRVDTSGTELALLAPGIELALERLAAIPALGVPRVVGPIRRTPHGGQSLQRAVLRLPPP